MNICESLGNNEVDQENFRDTLSTTRKKRKRSWFRVKVLTLPDGFKSFPHLSFTSDFNKEILFVKFSDTRKGTWFPGPVPS